MEDRCREQVRADHAEKQEGVTVARVLKRFRKILKNSIIGHVKKCINLNDTLFL